MIKKNINQNIFEKFHKNLKFQKRIIGDKNYTYREIISFIKKYIPAFEGRSALDIGCGSGALSFYLSSLGFSVYGIDVSRNAINTCVKNAIYLKIDPTINFRVIDFPKNYPSGTFDLILCSSVIEHIKNESLCFMTIRKMLKRNGIVLFSVPSKNALLYRLRLTLNFDRKVGHLRRYRKSDLIKKLTRQNFSIVETKGFEGVIGNFLFIFPKMNFLIRAANKFPLISDFIKAIDDISFKLFGESQIIVIAKKQLSKCE